MASTTTCRVLWFVPNTPSGISEDRSWIASALEQYGISVTQRTATPSALGSAVRAGREYDVVIGTTRAGGGMGLLGTLTGDVGFVVDHVDPISQLFETHPAWLARVVAGVERVAFARADHVIYYYDEERERIARPDSAVTKARLAIRYDRFASPEPALVERARDRLDGDCSTDNRLLYAGGLEPRYRIEPLLRAIGRLPDWTLVVCGTGSLESRVADAARSSDDVVFPGLVSHEQLAGYFRAVDVGICLVDDPHTLKVLEYGAAGLPVVQVDGRARAAYDGMVTFCSGTPGSIANAVRTAHVTGPSEELRERAKRHDIDAVVSLYEQVIRRVADRST